MNNKAKILISTIIFIITLGGLIFINNNINKEKSKNLNIVKQEQIKKEQKQPFTNDKLTEAITNCFNKDKDYILDTYNKKYVEFSHFFLDYYNGTKGTNFDQLILVNENKKPFYKCLSSELTKDISKDNKKEINNINLYLENNHDTYNFIYENFRELLKKELGNEYLRNREQETTINLTFDVNIENIEDKNEFLKLFKGKKYLKGSTDNAFFRKMYDPTLKAKLCNKINEFNLDKNLLKNKVPSITCE